MQARVRTRNPAADHALDIEILLRQRFPSPTERYRESA
jgi:hypothetical protein